MQGQDQANPPPGFIASSGAAPPPQLNTVGVGVPRPGMFSTRPLFSDVVPLSGTPVPISMTTNLSGTSSTHLPTPGAVHGIRTAQPMLGGVGNPLAVSISSQALSLHAPTVPVASIAGAGPPSAIVPPTLSSQSTMPPVVPHLGVGMTSYAAASYNLNVSASQPHVTAPAPAPPLQPVNNPQRPVQTVQPQVPVVQSMGASAMSVAGPQPVGHAQQFQRLKVEDALSYLDQVKLQFGNHPQVYNDFLDIMKEFKSQSIDTPGVISRVSNLFKGHPELIVGFNTFLPPGYKIEVQANDTISVQQPGQPSMSLSQLSGHQNREQAGPSAYKSKGPQPVNLSTGASHSGGAVHDTPRTGLDNVAAAASGSISSTPGQPVEFNHAINYVNKIKNRFQGQPDIYKNFLEILHRYQKEQKQIKDGLIPPNNKPLTETEVYSQVSKLFQNQEDLLKEFGQFLPDANGAGGFFGKSLYSEPRDHPPPQKKPYPITGKSSSSSKISGSGAALRKLGGSGVPPSKKAKLSSGYGKDMTFAEAGKYGSLAEWAFFDKVKKALRGQQDVYDNFLRCLHLFNQEVVSHSEVIQLVQPFLGKFPELFKKFKDILGYRESGGFIDAVMPSLPQSSQNSKSANDRMVRDDLSMEIDYSSCKRYGHSYRGLPKSYHPPRCSGRTNLCREVLNDVWVSFPSWSEESTFVTSRKTQFEEFIYRCEDERFELDMVIELNLATIKVLEGVQKKLQRMNSDEAAKFKLDNALGGFSEVIHRKAIRRIYGDKAEDIIDGLKKNPVVAVPLVLRRLKSKDDEWKEAQRQFNKIWREQNEKYYLKSLDHQGINFKQNDIKMLRSKNLLNEIEAIYDAEHAARREKEDAGADDAVPVAPPSAAAERRPHLSFVYKNKAMIDEALSLIIHHVRRQASMQKKDKQTIKQLLKQDIQKLLHRAVVPMSDDEDDDDDSDEDKDDSKSGSPPMDKTSTSGSRSAARSSKSAGKSSPGKEVPSSADESVKQEVKEEPKPEETTPKTEQPANDAMNSGVGAEDEADDEERYSLFYANSNWYFFLRLHQILCQRLHQIKSVCDNLVAEHEKCKQDNSETVAVALRLKMPSDLSPDQYFVTFTDMVKSLLDGNVESSAYEDQLRDLFGIHAYVAFTMDKVIQYIVKQLQYIVSDDLCREVTSVWSREGGSGSTGGVLSTRDDRSAQELAYRKSVEGKLSDDNLFEVVVLKNDSSLAITLLDTDSDSSASTAVGQAERWSEYIDKLVPGALDGPDISSEAKEHLKHKPIFLPRNVRSWLKNQNSKEKAKAAEDEACKMRSADKSSDNPPASTESGSVLPDTEAAAGTEKMDSDEAQEAENENAKAGKDDQKAEEHADVEVGGLEVPSDINLLDGQECSFNVNSFKMVGVVNSESFHYKRSAIAKAKQTHRGVSQAMYKPWSDFCQKWSDSHVDQLEMTRIKSWLNGDNLVDCKPCQTSCRNDNDLNKSPYRPYNRYSVKYEKVTAAVAPSLDDSALTALSGVGDESMDMV